MPDTAFSNYWAAHVIERFFSDGYIHLSLHWGDPGTTGAYEITKASNRLSWGNNTTNAINRAHLNDAAFLFEGVTGTASHIGLWANKSWGWEFVCGGVLAVPIPADSLGRIQVLKKDVAVYMGNAKMPAGMGLGGVEPDPSELGTTWFLADPATNARVWINSGAGWSDTGQVVYSISGFFWGNNSAIAGSRSSGSNSRRSTSPFTTWSNVDTKVKTVDMGFDGTRWVAGGAAGYYGLSSDGVTWTLGGDLGASNVYVDAYNGQWYYSQGGNVYRTSGSTFDPATATRIGVFSSTGGAVGIKHNGTTLLIWANSSSDYLVTMDSAGTIRTHTSVRPNSWGEPYTGVGPDGFVLSCSGTSSIPGPVFAGGPSGPFYHCTWSDGSVMNNANGGFGNAYWDGVRWKMVGRNKANTGWSVLTSTDGIRWSEEAACPSGTLALLGYDAPYPGHPA